MKSTEEKTVELLEESRNLLAALAPVMYHHAEHKQFSRIQKMINKIDDVYTFGYGNTDVICKEEVY
jgi:hypothetical protein